MAQFDFNDSPVHQPSMDLLLDGTYITEKRNIIFVGGPGTGKTHLASAMGIEAATHGAKVRFFNVFLFFCNSHLPCRCAQKCRTDELPRQWYEWFVNKNHRREITPLRSA